MSFSRPTFLLSCCFLLSISVQAQQSSSAPTSVVTSDPQAIALVQRALVALTGGAGINDVTLAGTATRIAGSDYETGTANLEATVLGDSRVDLSLSSGNRREIRNHAAMPLADSLPPGSPDAAVQAQTETAQPAGVWSGPDGVSHAMATHNVMTDPTWFFPVATVTRILSSQDYVLSYIGPATLSGQQATEIRIYEPLPTSVGAPQEVSGLMEHLSGMQLYLDPNTLLPVALAFSIHPDDNAVLDIPTIIQFSGYQVVSGIEIPFHVQKYLNNSLVLDLQISSASLNSGLSATSFQIQ